MQSPVRSLVLLFILAWTPVHAGFLEQVFGDSAKSRSATLVAPDIAPAVSGEPYNSTPLLFSDNVSDYRLGAGDKLGITVFNEKELSMEVRLSDAGSFLYPFLGEVVAKNKTISDVQALLTRQLKDGYLVDPKVYVNILEYRPFFVNGEVNKPGGFPFQPGLTIRKAISLAGGLTPRASVTKIYVIHENDPTGMPRLTLLSAVLLPGDIVTVDQSFF
jgi:protein involved in polysaccharide export with SLBB domain